jgi:4-carboxymuconolactone decarboxylase
VASRLARPEKDTLTPEAQAIWDFIAAPRSTSMGGPYGILMHTPALAKQVAETEDYFRLNAALSAADREVVVLAAVREMGARYAWARHEARGLQVGVRPEAIEILRAQGGPDGLTPRERLLVEVAHTLARTRALPDELYARALAELGQQQLIEVVALVGHYGLVGLVLNAFTVPPPDGAATF